MSKSIVAIIGRQNVGKSTLLNRLAGKPIAIIEDIPGTTRDRIFADICWEGIPFTVVDTGGLDVESRDNIAQWVKKQVVEAIAEADVIIFLLDVRDGVVPSDWEIVDMLRRVNKSILLAVNKVDNEELEAGIADFFQLGLGEPLPISAYHGLGIAKLMNKTVSLLPKPMLDATDLEKMKVAIVGRPNVGKSMLVNAFLNEERVIVDDLPGTTRDAIDTLFDVFGQSILLIDTAGIRRRGKLGTGLERYSVIRALRAIDRADIVLLVLDAVNLVTSQDMHIAGYIKQAVKGTILLVNKWDLVENKDVTQYNRNIKHQFKFMSYAPVLYISAKFGLGIEKIMPKASEIYHERHKRISTTEVNNVIQQALAVHNLPRMGKKQLKLLYVTQADVNPPTFVFFVNDTKLIHFSYRRYLENKLRKAFGFIGTPLCLNFKTRTGS